MREIRKTHQLRLVVFPIIYKVLYIPGGDRRISSIDSISLFLQMVGGLGPGDLGWWSLSTLQGTITYPTQTGSSENRLKKCRLVGDMLVSGRATIAFH